MPAGGNSKDDDKKDKKDKKDKGDPPTTTTETGTGSIPTTPDNPVVPGTGGGDEGVYSRITDPPATGRDHGPGESGGNDAPASDDRIALVAAALIGVTFPLVVSTRYGSVSIADMRIVDGPGNSPSWVDVTCQGEVVGGDQHFRIFNPPTLVEDPNGEIIGSDGTRYRQDPILAVVESVATNGGKIKK
jgi:hypothetical protein